MTSVALGRLARPFLPVLGAIAALLTPALVAQPASAAGKAAQESVSTMKSFAAPDTPASLNRVRILKQGDPKADHVLVLIPGTSGGAAYFRPMGKAIVKQLPGYQVWSIERRENLLEDHTRLDQELNGEIDVQAMFDYYLGWIADNSIDPHFEPVTSAQAPFVREWGMNVAVEDIRRVVEKAAKKDRTVVLGGHSLGGSMTTAYASWDFNGKAGIDDLSGLVYIDGGSLGGDPPTAEEAQASLDSLQGSSPFLDLLGVGLPWAAGAFNATGSAGALDEPDAPSVAADFPLLPPNLKPPVPSTNRGQYGYAFDVDTSPASLALIHVHIGTLAAAGDPRGWQNGELGTVQRTADAFRGIENMDGTAWYHPRRLSLDSSAVNNGIANPAQEVLGEKAIHGDELDVPILAFETSLGWAGGASRVIAAAEQLAEQSGVKGKDLKLISKPQKYAHIDPLTATPKKNAFLKALIPFLRKRIG